MNMLVDLLNFKGSKIEAKDGSLGSVSDFYFDDQTFKLRWLIADTGQWLPGREVLIHPSAFGIPHPETHTIPVNLSKEQIEKSPDIAADQPVSMQMEAHLYDYYGWDPVWGAGLGGISAPISTPAYFGSSELAELEKNEGEKDPHLRSFNEVAGYHIHATDGDIGHLHSFFADPADWGIRYLAVDTKNWWPGEHVLIAPFAVRQIIWEDREIRLNLTRDQVRSSPPWDRAETLGLSYQQRLHGHYGWPGFGF